jgi:predicted exporter
LAHAILAGSSNRTSNEKGQAQIDGRIAAGVTNGAMSAYSFAPNTRVQRRSRSGASQAGGRQAVLLVLRYRANWTTASDASATATGDVFMAGSS